MRSSVAIIVALAAPLLFPSAFAFVLVLIAAVVVPPVGLLAGALTDALYYTPTVGAPYATIAGLFITVIGYVVHRFIKTRIIDA